MREEEELKLVCSCRKAEQDRARNLVRLIPASLVTTDHQAQQPPAYGQAPFAQPPGPAGGAPWGAPPPQQGFPQHGFPQQGYPQPGYGHPGPSGSAYGFPQQPPPGPGGYPEFKYDDALPGYSQAQSGQPYNAQQQYYFSNQPGVCAWVGLGVSRVCEHARTRERKPSRLRQESTLCAARIPMAGHTDTVS